MTRLPRRLAVVAAGAALALGPLALVSLSAPASAAPARVAATGSCRSVGGGAATAGGPNRATVVVDTGTGPVWSACVSFSGTISGIEALNRADAVIADLDPVYDQYTGLGRAVCRLRGVGSDPPDCLGKTTSYWSYSHNGRVASVGGGAVTVHDGDVEGWRYGSGSLPRAATQGTEAASAPPATTTTRPVTTTTAPAGTKGGGGSGSGLTASTTPGTPAGPGSGAVTTTTVAGSTTSTTVAGAATTTVVGSTTVTTAVPKDGSSSAGTGASKTAAGAAASATGGGSSSGSSGGSGGSGSSPSSLPSVLGFVATLGLIGTGGVIVRRRRVGLTTA